MTLEERMARIEEFGGLVQGTMKAVVKAGTSDHNMLGEVIKRIDALEDKLKDIDVMVLAIHETLKAIQEGI